ncbi:MAG: 3-(3-hydroxy-phenyl)propionate hydroxylase [Variibacter sp.]|nr:3-(3-hydroxy-phenyl)propionate hydroxylase [Variibacter sp.]
MVSTSERPEPHKALFQYAYTRSSDQDAAPPVCHPIVIVGAGPVGLTAAIDLALRGIPVVLLDDSDRIGDGSRGICYAKRSLEIWDRLGVGERLVDMGVTWKLGKVFLGDELVYSFDLLPEEGHKMPAFINLQQFSLEKVLVDRACELDAIDLRWKNKVVGLEQRNDCVRLTIETPDGLYALDAEWVIAADGARSPARDMLGLGFQGVTFEDKFLIADIKMAADFPTERRFWFDPQFHSGQSALMHRQPNNVWRIDLQLGPEADVNEEQKPERVLPRLRRMLGERDFELEWVSIYRFNCRRLERFVHGRVVFAGDSAHQVSPFGARGGNSGVQDAENLAWKLAAVLRGEAGAGLLESYNAERVQAADENIAHSTRSTDFIAPRSPAERCLRNAVLALAPEAEFARRMVNSGRLSVATVHDSPLLTPDADGFDGSARLGAPIPDAPVRTAEGRDCYLLDVIPGAFTLLWVDDGGPKPDTHGLESRVIGSDLIDLSGRLSQRLDCTPGATYLLRPDQHLCARWRRYDPATVDAALARARGL